MEKCCVCKTANSNSRHHLIPRRYNRYLPDHWKKNNVRIHMCRTCHTYLEWRLEHWYTRMENTVKTENFSSKVMLIKRLNTDRKVFKFVMLMRRKIMAVFNTRLNPYERILSVNLLHNCDETLKKYLNNVYL